MGCLLGFVDGKSDGVSDGKTLGNSDGLLLGSWDESTVGYIDGRLDRVHDGGELGLFVGAGPKSHRREENGGEGVKLRKARLSKNRRKLTIRWSTAD